jgi:hypothetical protein
VIIFFSIYSKKLNNFITFKYKKKTENMKKLIIAIFLGLSSLSFAQSRAKLLQKNDSLQKVIDNLRYENETFRASLGIAQNTKVKDIARFQEIIMAASARNSIIFNLEDYMYIVDISNYTLKDIYTGNIQLMERRDECSRNWELLLLLKSVKYMRFRV